MWEPDYFLNGIDPLTCFEMARSWFIEQKFVPDLTWTWFTLFRADKRATSTEFGVEFRDAYTYHRLHKQLSLQKKRSQKKSQECFLYCFINALVSYIILLRSDMSVDNQMLQWLRDSFRRVYFGFFNWFHSGLICYQLVFQSWLTWRCSATVRTAITISSRDSGRGTRWQLTTPCRPSGSTMIWPSQLLNRVRLWHTPWLVYMTIQGMQVEEKVESAILKIQFCMIIIVLSNEK